MSRIGYIGRSFRLLYQGEILAAVRTKSVNHIRAAIDCSDEERDGWRHLDPKYESVGVEISVEGVATPTNYALLEQWLGDTFTELAIGFPDGTIEIAADGAFLQSLTHSGKHDGFVAFEASFIFSGLVTAGIAPILTLIDPESTVVPGDAFEMTLTGEHFLEGAVALWAGTPLETTFVSETELLAEIPASLLEEVGVVQVSVRNPSGITSNSLPFTITIGVEAIIQTDSSLSWIARSVDGGESWETISMDSAFFGAAYSNELKRFVIVGASGAIETSDDGGLTWTPRTSGVPNNLYAVAWLRQFGLFAARGRRLNAANPERMLWSADGEEWHLGTIDLPETTQYDNAWIIDAPEIGIAFSVRRGGSNGLRSTDGKAWSRVSVSPAFGTNGLAFADWIRMLFIIDQGGRIVRSLDGLEFELALETPSVQFAIGISALERAIFGDEGNVYSTEDGLSFDSVSAEVFAGSMGSMDMLWSRRFERIVGVAGSGAANPGQRVYSEDGGDSWTTASTYSNAGRVKAAVGVVPGPEE